MSLLVPGSACVNDRACRPSPKSSRSQVTGVRASRNGLPILPPVEDYNQLADCVNANRRSPSFATSCASKLFAGKPKNFHRLRKLGEPKIIVISIVIDVLYGIKHTSPGYRIGLKITS